MIRAARRAATLAAVCAVVWAGRNWLSHVALDAMGWGVK